MSDRGNRSIVRLRLMLPLVLLTALARALLAEEALPTQRAFRRYEPVKDLSVAEKEYIEWAQDFIHQVMRSARSRAIRSKAMIIISALSALAVTVTVGRTPALVPALLGLVSAAGQAVEGVSRDREQAHLSHQMAVKLQRVLREFHTAVGRDLERNQGRQAGTLFDAFQRRFEEIKESEGAEILKVRGQEPPRIAQLRG